MFCTSKSRSVVGTKPSESDLQLNWEIELCPLAEALELWPGPIEELAEAVGVQRNTLYVYASGRRTPPASLLGEVAQLLEQRTREHANRAREVAKELREVARNQP